MIIQEFYIKKYDWLVRIYYFVDEYYVSLIEKDLKDLECEDVKECIKPFKEGKLNAGLTYTNPDYNTSVVVIGKTLSPEEFFSTYDHEKGHLAVHIAISEDLDLTGEDIQYLSGTIAKKTFKIAQMFLCEHCNCNIEKYKGKFISES